MYAVSKTCDFFFSKNYVDFKLEDFKVANGILI